MKHFTLLSALLLAACAPIAATDRAGDIAGWTINGLGDAGGDLNAFFDCLAAERIALVSAHRGGPALGYPENALSTLTRTMALAPALLEIDVTQSADGVLFLLHDETLERTTTGKGEASERAWDEIKKLRLKDAAGRVSNEAPPRFEDVLEWAGPRTILEIDIKRAARYENLAAAIKAQGAEDRVILIAYTVGQAAKLHRLLPGAMISLKLDTMSDLNRAVASGLPGDRLLGFTGTGEPEPRLFSAFAGRGVEVVYGALGSAGEDRPYAEIAGMGADIIATDFPVEAHASLAAAGRGARAGVCGIADHP